MPSWCRVVEVSAVGTRSRCGSFAHFFNGLLYHCCGFFLFYLFIYLFIYFIYFTYCWASLCSPNAGFTLRPAANLQEINNLCNVPEAQLQDGSRKAFGFLTNVPKRVFGCNQDSLSAVAQTITLQCRRTYPLSTGEVDWDQVFQDLVLDGFGSASCFFCFVLLFVFSWGFGLASFLFVVFSFVVHEGFKCMWRRGGPYLLSMMSSCGNWKGRCLEVLLWLKCSWTGQVQSTSWAKTAVLVPFGLRSSCPLTFPWKVRFGYPDCLPAQMWRGFWRS